VRADHDHALDVWQWVRRLEPRASLALQIAALFHDVERLASEADTRVEQHAEDYVAFKESHAARGSLVLEAALRDLDLGASLSRAMSLVARHERPGADHELLVLNDADALSFFALNSAGFLSYFGEAHTRMKVRYTLARLSERAREHLRYIRLLPHIAALITEAEGRAHA
jgi:hypothetical protein